MTGKQFNHKVRLVTKPKVSKPNLVTYKASGVNIDRSNEAKNRIKKYVRSTFSENVLLDFGKFGGAFDLQKVNSSFSNPVLISSTDGVGTKLMVAARMEKWDSVGIDLVNHSVNDILCCGAAPLFFLDYVAGAKLEPRVVEQIVKGLAFSCKRNGIALVGGETAEMPGVYSKGEYDLAGTIVGVVEKNRIVDGKKIQPGDILIGLPSSGLHTNGYSLARKIFFDIGKYNVNDFVPQLNSTVGNALLKPHKSYLKPVKALMEKIELKGIAHITGGGLLENIPRILPKGIGVKLFEKNWKIPPLFKLMQQIGNVPRDDMFRTFNMGIGMILIISPKDKEIALQELKKSKEKPRVIGHTAKGQRKVEIQ